VIDKLEERCTFCGAASDLTQFRSKLVCAVCKADLAGAGPATAE
jgi:hypothetical protein